MMAKISDTVSVFVTPEEAGVLVLIHTYPEGYASSGRSNEIQIIKRLLAKGLISRRNKKGIVTYEIRPGFSFKD